ncbi:hypothetical protein N0V91_003806 [Didymella pomorum]|uniref:Uncharacterized protein n=1 Tax=Didymella pomorum TaxID=749634 RepID=A0A9W9D9T3_9PLEO|nr:hypothetical protein N0V91_003806 [Didymella pomorum]
MAEQESHPGIAYGEDVLGELLLLLTDFNESCNEQAHPGVDAAAQPVMTELSVESLNANSYLHVIASPADCRERERRSDEKNTVNAVRRSHWSSIIP